MNAQSANFSRNKSKNFAFFRKNVQKFCEWKPTAHGKKDLLQVANNELYTGVMRGESTLHGDHTSYNVFYFNHFSTMLDIKTIFKTFKLLVSITNVQFIYI